MHKKVKQGQRYRVLAARYYRYKIIENTIKGKVEVLLSENYKL